MYRHETDSGSRREAAVLRVLIADDQIPDESIRDSDVIAWARDQYPQAHDGFIDAFGVMRQALKILRDGSNVTAARRFNDALNFIRNERFDVAIIDLGWAGDSAVPADTERTAGWKLVEAIQNEDAKHPERQPTAQINYSSRFEVQPTLGQEAAQQGVLPFYKPYGERHSLPLGQEPEKKVGREERVRVASESLLAVVKFIEHLRTREVERLLQTAREGTVRASKDQHEWHRLTLLMVAAGALIVFAGVVASLFGGVAEGAVTAASGVIVALIPKLMYGRLDKAQSGIRDARLDLERALEKARML